MYNKLLDCQLKEHFGETGTVLKDLLPFFKVISDSYDQHDKDFNKAGGLVDPSSKGMNEVNAVWHTEENPLKERSSKKFLDIERDRFNDLFLQAPFCMGILKGPDHIFEMANHLYLQLIDKDDILGRSVKEVLPEIAAQGFIELLDEVYRTGKSFSANEMLIKLDKEGNGKLNDSYLNFSYQSYQDKDGHIDGIFFFAINVTEQVLSRKKIEESEKRYRSFIEQATDAICIADASLQFVDMNPYACEFLGYTKEEALQLFVPDILFPEDMATNPIHKFGTIKTKETIRNERRFKRKDGSSVVMEVSTRLMEDGRFIMFGHDVSERKKAEEIIQRSEASLNLMNKELELKNKELEHFAYVASHDLQEPLRTTAAFVDLLQEQYGGKLDEKAGKYLQYISESSGRMKVLITDLLDYSRIGNKKELQQVDCNIILDEVLQDLGSTLNETGAAINVGLLPVISGYQTEIKQLFQNLIVNAIKFRKKDTTPEVSISAEKVKAHWTFSIRDNGIGIAEDHKDRIFVIFQRLHTRTEFEGSGIGLAFCKKIVGLHGGDIWVESKPNEGARFYFTIP